MIERITIEWNFDISDTSYSPTRYATNLADELGTPNPPVGPYTFVASDITVAQSPSGNWAGGAVVPVQVTITAPDVDSAVAAKEKLAAMSCTKLRAVLEATGLASCSTTPPDLSKAIAGPRYGGTFAYVSRPAPPPSTPPAEPTAAGALGEVGSAITSDAEEFPWWIFIILGILLCCCCPLLCCFCYARRRFGEGNEFLWFRYLLYQTNPEVPWFYMPKDVHERLKLQLYNPEAFQAELEAWQKEVIEEQDAAGIKRGFGDAGAMSMGGSSGPAKLSIS